MLDSTFAWLSFVNDYVTVSYKDNNILSFSLILALCTVIPLVWIVLPVKIFNNVVCIKPSIVKKISIVAMYPLGIIFSLLLGFQFILLLVMSTVGQWYIGGPLLCAFWICCFLLINRSFVWPKGRTGKKNIHKLNQTVQHGDSLYQNDSGEQVEQALITEFQEDEEEDFLHMHETTAIERFKIKGREFLVDVKEFLRDIFAGFYARKVFSITMIILFSALAFTLSLMTCNTCIIYYPHEISTTFGRMVLNQGKICDYNTICFTYLTVPQDISTSMIANFQLYGPVPEKSFVLVAKSSFVHFNSTYIDIDYRLVTYYPATCFKMPNVEEERHHCWSDLTSLKPNTVYYYIPQFVMSATSNITSQSEYKFVTGPAVNQNKTVIFTTGGGMQWTDAALKLAKFAVKERPLFAMIGGDIAFDNGDSSCYRRWDQWFNNWMTYMVHPNTNLSIPILTTIGDHEAGGFMRSRDKTTFYMRFFPHQIGLQNVDPQDRPLYHYHIFASHVIILALDSWIHTDPKEQIKFIDDTLQEHANRGNNFMIYHSAIYPSRIIDKGSVDFKVVTSLHEHWLPLFDKHNVSCVFENHFHLYKRTFPLFQDEIQVEKAGTTYLGDGAWGLRYGASEEQIAKSSQFKVLMDVENVEHFYLVKALHDKVHESELGYARVQPWGYNEEEDKIEKLSNNDIVV
jgi:hypothetical protein